MIILIIIVDKIVIFKNKMKIEYKIINRSNKIVDQKNFLSEELKC